MLVCQRDVSCLDHRFREKARSHRGLGLFTSIAGNADQMWERACSRKTRRSPAVTPKTL
ncbi:hypothetical protein EMIT0P43_60204 [Pseudomonas jessenii]